MKSVDLTGVDTSTLPTLNNVEMDDLIKKVKSGDEKAKEMFIFANIRLVLSIVRRFHSHRSNVDDLFQIGCIGLMKATNNFKPEYGLRFSTYAVPMVMGEIRRFIRDDSALRVSRSMRDIAYRALAIKNNVFRKEGKNVTLAELETLMEIPAKKIAAALDAIGDVFSFSAPISKSSEGEATFIDQFADVRTTPTVIDEKIELHSAIEKLEPRERMILSMRYFVGKTQSEVSLEVGISQAQVSRLEKNALKSIKVILK